MNVFPQVSLEDVFPAVVRQMNFVRVRHAVARSTSVSGKPLYGSQRLRLRFLQKFVSMFKENLALFRLALYALPSCTFDSVEQKEAQDTLAFIASMGNVHPLLLS